MRHPSDRPSNATPEGFSELDVARMQASAREASRLLRALSNPHRLLIMCQLIGHERSVGELVRLIGLSQSALSQHLAKLRRDALVRTRREAQTIYYSLASPEAEAVIATLYQLFCSTPGRREMERA